MSCPAVNLPSVSHGEDLLSPIYLFATWTIEGPRPAEFSIIKPPTIFPTTPSPPPPPMSTTLGNLQVSLGINPRLNSGSAEPEGRGRREAREGGGSDGEVPSQRGRPGDGLAHNHPSGKLTVLRLGEGRRVQPNNAAPSSQPPQWSPGRARASRWQALLSPRLATPLRDQLSGMRLSLAGQGAAGARRRGSSSPHTPPGTTAPSPAQFCSPLWAQCTKEVLGEADGDAPPDRYRGSCRSETRWGWWPG